MKVTGAFKKREANLYNHINNQTCTCLIINNNFLPGNKLHVQFVTGAGASTIKAMQNTPKKRESFPHRVCHKNGDICVQATIGTGPTPKFNFVIMPQTVKKLTETAKKSRKHYCDYMKAFFKDASDSCAV